MATNKVPAPYKLKLLLLISIAVKCGVALVDDNNPYRHKEVLDRDGKYILEWSVDLEQSRITFNVTVQTLGYVALGISMKGKMSGADIVIGGVLPNGQIYFTDRHAIANQLPVIDDHQDWTLHSAQETETHTFLSFSRPFETCDKDHDLPINDDVLSLIWAFGENDDEIEYHHQNRGSFEVYLLDPDLSPRNLLPGQRQLSPNKFGNLKIWSISGGFTIPAQDTTYICTMHKSPNTNGRKQHIVGFNSILESDTARRHIHHFLLHKCTPPPGQSAASIFERHVGNRGEECYILRQPAGRIPTQYCTEVYYVWEVNGKPFFLPDHTGMPLNAEGDEYYMLQMHFDNPDRIVGQRVQYTLETFYTDVRENDAGVISIGEMTPASPSIMVPPGSVGHVTYGHCGSGCTSKFLPREGIHIFAVNLHTHLAGRGIRLVHIRNNQELPWILYDNNYNFNFQQIRLLKEEKTVLPGDTVINRCVFGNTDRNGSVTVGGFSSRNEMCNGFVWYYNKIPNHSTCRGEIRSDVYRSFLNIWNTTWSNTRIENVVTVPSQNAGLTVSEVGNFRLDWTIARRNQISKYHRYLPQITMCPPYVVTDDNDRPGGRFYVQPRTRYPDARRFSRITDRTGNDKVAATSVQNEIIDPEYEFVSIYPEDIVPYELPDICHKK